MKDQVNAVLTYQGGSAQRATLPVNDTFAYRDSDFKRIAQSPSRLSGNEILDNRQGKESTALSSADNRDSLPHVRHQKSRKKVKHQKGQKKVKHQKGQKKMMQPKLPSQPVPQANESNKNSRAGNSVSYPGEPQSRPMLVSRGCRNELAPSTTYIDGKEVKITTYRELSTISPIKMSLFNDDLLNLELVDTSAMNEIKKMSDDAIVEFLFQQTGGHITINEAHKIRSSIKELSVEINYFLQNRECFMFFSAHDNPGILGMYRDKKIYLSDTVFSKPSIIQLFIMEHEGTHGVGAKDYRYYNIDAYDKNGSRGIELIDMSATKATRIFLMHLSRQIYAHLSAPNYNHDFPLNADSIAFFALSLYYKNRSDPYQKALINSATDIKSPENNEALPSLAYREYPPRY